MKISSPIQIAWPTSIAALLKKSTRRENSLNLDRTTVIAGLPIKTVRDAIREMNRHDVNEYGWTVEKLAAHIKVSETHAEWLCETLLERGVLARKPQPDRRWHERGMYYGMSETGTRFINATMLK